MPMPNAAAQLRLSTVAIFTRRGFDSTTMNSTPYRMSMAATTGGLCRCSVIQSSSGRPITMAGRTATSTLNHITHTSCLQ